MELPTSTLGTSSRLRAGSRAHIWRKKQRRGIHRGPDIGRRIAFHRPFFRRSHRRGNSATSGPTKPSQRRTDEDHQRGAWQDLATGTTTAADVARAYADHDDGHAASFRRLRAASDNVRSSATAAVVSPQRLLQRLPADGWWTASYSGDHPPTNRTGDVSPSDDGGWLLDATAATAAMLRQPDDNTDLLDSGSTATARRIRKRCRSRTAAAGAEGPNVGLSC